MNEEVVPDGPEPDGALDDGEDSSLTTPPTDALTLPEPAPILGAVGDTYEYDYENDAVVDDHDYNDDFWDQQ
jgi:hypothetical protein